MLLLFKQKFGNCSEWPTIIKKSVVIEDFSLRELVIELLGEDGLRKIRNRTKPNNQLFTEYYTVLETTRPLQQSYENTRVLKKFHLFIGEFPPTPELAI